MGYTSYNMEQNEQTEANDVSVYIDWTSGPAKQFLFAGGGGGGGGGLIIC
jgi:hypothetical protein